MLDAAGFFASLANRALLRASMPRAGQIAFWVRFWSPSPASSIGSPGITSASQSSRSGIVYHDPWFTQGARFAHGIAHISPDALYRYP